MATATQTPADPPVPAPAPPLVPGQDILYEVVDGRIVEKPPMGALSTDIATLLVEYLGPFARANRLGRVFCEMLFRIDQAKNLQRRPDVAFVGNERWPYNRLAPDVPAWDMVPDLAIEVISPSNLAEEVQIKIHEYFHAGVRQVWVVYPPTFEVYVYSSPTEIRVLQRGDELDGAPLLPGFRLALATLFEDEAEGQEA